MPGIDGLEATRRLLDGSTADATGAAVPRPRIAMLTTFDLDEYVYAALQAGAAGFLLKDITPEHLVGAVRTVAVGDALLAPSITRRLIERYARPEPMPETARESLERLTARETEVFKLLARGMSNAEISEVLVVTEATVKTHVTAILAKLELRNRAQASARLRVGPGTGGSRVGARPCRSHMRASSSARDTASMGSGPTRPISLSSSRTVANRRSCSVTRRAGKE